MTASEPHHRLAAILSADVVGYSRLMAEDEDATVRTLNAYREEIGLLVRQHHGRLVDFRGDDFLAEFPAAVDAVKCAVEIQKVLKVRNESLPQGRQMQFRIGIHLGDVRVEGERIYGDGVNIAARLEGLAEPGAVCLSGTVHEQVRQKLDLGYEDLGEKEVKNIPYPVRVFRVRMESAPAPVPAGRRARRYTTVLAQAPAKRRWGPFALIAGAVVVATAVLALVMLDYDRPLARNAEPRLPVQLTAYPPAQSLTDAKISPDGNYLALVAAGGVYLQTLATREVHEVQLEWTGQPTKVAWSADGSRLYLFGSKPGLWSVSQFGGRPRLIDGAAETAAVSPDGKYLAAVRTDELGRSRAQVWLMASDGTKARQLLTPKDDDSFWQIAWTPDSKRIVLGTWSRRVRIDTVALDGSDRTTLLESEELFQNWTGVLPFAWCGDGRLVFARRDGPTHQVTSNVWIAETNVMHKALKANPKRLTQWVASNVRALSADAKCSRVVAMRATNQLDVFVAEFTTAGLSNLRQITLDERQDHAEDWNGSADTLLLQSSRAGTWDLFEQALHRETPTVLLSAAGDQTKPAYALGGAYIVYLDGGEDANAGSIHRVPRNGGAPVEVLAGRYHRVECATDSSGCVAGGVRGTEYVFTAFDVLTGESRELVRIEHRVPFTEWDLAPDGTRVAVVHNDNNEVRIVHLAGGGDQIVTVPGWHGFEFITWMADGAGFVVNATPEEEGIVPRSHAGLIHVDLAGTPTLLRRHPNEWDVWPVMAPDGRHIAFSTMRFHANAWLIENP